MGVDLRARYGAAVTHRLAPGERIRALREAKRPQGPAPGPAPVPPEPDPDAGAKVAGVTVLDVVLSGAEFIDNLGGGGPVDWLLRLLFGRAAHGRLSSVAGGYAIAVPTDERILVVVTGRRLMVLRIDRSVHQEIRAFGEDPTPARPDQLTPLWWACLVEVAGARRRWHRLHGARLRVAFRDGSWLELTGPLCLGQRGAEELRAALAG